MSIFPMIDPASVQDQNTAALPLCREVSWDFERDVPMYRGGEPVIAEGAEALKVWIWRAVRTPRYKYEIYTWAYGSEFESLIGKAFNDTVKTAEAPRYLRECLLINPYIKDIRDISVAFSGDKLKVEGTADTVYGEVPINAIV